MTPENPRPIETVDMNDHHTARKKAVISQKVRSLIKSGIKSLPLVALSLIVSSNTDAAQKSDNSIQTSPTTTPPTENSFPFIEGIFPQNTWGNTINTTAISYDGNLLAGEAGKTEVQSETDYHNIFVFDRVTNLSQLISISNAGEPQNDNSINPAISGNGNYVAFESRASNLVDNDNNFTWDIFLYNRSTSTIKGVSFNSSGQPGNSPSSNPHLSYAGNYLVFESPSDNLVVNDNQDLIRDIFLYDNTLNTLTNVTSGVLHANAGSYLPQISSDGKSLSFGSYANNLVVDDNNNYCVYEPNHQPEGCPDVFVYNRETHEVEIVSVSSEGEQQNGGWGNSQLNYRTVATISGDGRFVAFDSNATNLVPNDTNNSWDVFLRDRLLNTTKRISVSSNGSEGNWDSIFPSISSDGRYIVFESWANNLVPNDTNSCFAATWVNGYCPDIFVHDQATNETFRISRPWNGIDNPMSERSFPLNPRISGDGNHVSFVSVAGGLLPYNTDYYGTYVKSNLPLPFLSLPTNYTYSGFLSVLAGNINGQGPGRVNAFFDHNKPDYSLNNLVALWSGTTFTGTGTIYTGTVSAAGCATGQNCYDGHSGIDFSRKFAGEQAFPAATGTVFNIVDNCVLGNRTCGGGLGNQVWIDHGNGYATIYGHFASVSVTNGQQITDLSTPLGIIGSTGNSSGAHAHFEVRYNLNGNGIWESSEVVDPYGWQGTEPDPAGENNHYLWNQNIWKTQVVPETGGSITFGNVTAQFPSGQPSSSIYELWQTGAEAAAFGNLRPIGISFWLRLINGSEQTQNLSNILGPNDSITLTVNYDESQLEHLNEEELVVMKLDESTQSWTPLSTTVDTNLNIATAYTNNVGRFDLQAPLECEDVSEPNDNYDTALNFQVDTETITGTLDIESDQDWYGVNMQSGSGYEIQIKNVSSGTKTLIQVFDVDGTSLLASIENSTTGITSTINLIAPRTGKFFVKVSPGENGNTNCASEYEFDVNSFANPYQYSVYLPSVSR